MMNLRTIIILTSLLLGLGCTRKNESENVLNVPLTGEISTLDPANSYDTVSNSIVYQVYEQLFDYHYLRRPYQLQPLLAAEMPQISDDGLTYTIKLKKDVPYHNDPAFKGQKRFLKAQDFVTQIKRLAWKATNSNGWWLFDGKIVGINDFREEVGDDFSLFKKSSIKGLVAPDDHTLIIKLTQPYPQMIYALAMGFTSPMPLEVLEEYGNDLGRHMVGTGPFYLEDFQSLSGVTLKKFEGYANSTYPSKGDRIAHGNDMLADAGKSLPFLSKINFKIIKEDQTRWLNFRAGKIDLLVVPKDNFSTAVGADGSLSDELKKDAVNLIIGPTLTYWWLEFNMTDPVVGGAKNLKIRKAISHAINFNKYIEVFTNNVGQRANSIYPPGIPGYDPAKRLPYDYDIERAKKLLAEAGYPEGKGLPTLKFDVRGSSARNRQESQFIKSELAQIGIQVEVIMNTFPAFLEKARNGKLQFWQGGWAMDYPDAENCLQLLVTKNHPPGPNSSYFSHPKFDQHFERLKLMNEGPDKWALMDEMEEIVHTEMPWIMQYYARNYILHHGRLKNFRHSDLIFNYFKYLKVQ
jgi:oligopeptide transport system substrate-binding protein